MKRATTPPWPVLSLLALSPAAESLAETTNQPVHLLVVGPQGSPVDQTANAMVPALAEKTGRQVIVSHYSSSPELSKALAEYRSSGLVFARSDVVAKFDADATLTPVTGVAKVPYVIVVPIEKTTRGKFNIAVQDWYPNLLTPALSQPASTVANSPEAIQDVAAGKVDMALVPYASYKNWSHSGKLKSAGVIGTAQAPWAEAGAVTNAGAKAAVPIVGIFALSDVSPELRLEVKQAATMAAASSLNQFTSAGVVPFPVSGPAL
jgi:hypothetical protein